MFFYQNVTHLQGHPRVFIPLNISVIHFQLLINVIPLLDRAAVSSFSVSFKIILKLGQLWGCPKIKTVFRIFVKLGGFCNTIFLSVVKIR